MPSRHLILCMPLLLLPSIFPSIWVFSDQSVLLIRWPKYWSFSFSIIPSNEYSGLISFRINWFDLLAVQGTFKSLLQHHSSKASNLWCSAFFIVQLSHSYMTTGKTIHICYILKVCLAGVVFPASSDSKESAFQCRRPRFDPWVGKIPWRREWLPTPVFLPGESHGQRSLVGYSLWGCRELDMTEQLTLTFHFHIPKRVVTSTLSHSDHKIP